MKNNIYIKYDKKIRDAVQFSSPITCESDCVKILNDAINEALCIGDISKCYSAKNIGDAYDEGFKDGVNIIIKNRLITT